MSIGDRLDAAVTCHSVSTQLAIDDPEHYRRYGNGWDPRLGRCVAPVQRARRSATSSHPRRRAAIEPATAGVLAQRHRSGVWWKLLDQGTLRFPMPELQGSWRKYRIIERHFGAVAFWRQLWFDVGSSAVPAGSTSSSGVAVPAGHVRRILQRHRGAGIRCRCAGCRMWITAHRGPRARRAGRSRFRDPALRQRMGLAG